MFVISGIIKVSVNVISFGRTCLDLDYSGYHKNLIQLLFSIKVTFTLYLLLTLLILTLLILASLNLQYRSYNPITMLFSIIDNWHKHISFLLSLLLLWTTLTLLMMAVLTIITAPFIINMRTLAFKAQPTNAFFATVNQVFGDSSQLPTTVERVVIKSLSTVQITKQCSAVVGS